MAVPRYFKGDIVMASVDGHGTDTYVYLQVMHHKRKNTLHCILSFSEAVTHGNGEPACLQFFLQQQAKEHFHPGPLEQIIVLENNSKHADNLLIEMVDHRCLTGLITIE